MTTSPVVTITDELIAELEAAASYCVTEVIRSHPWSEQDFDLLRADERYVRAASPELVRALLAERAQLKRDAGRYWWLNDSPHSFGILRAMSTGDLTGPMVDDAIDAAMQAAQ